MRLALIFNKDRAGTTGLYFERACRLLGIPHDHWWLRDVERIPAEYDAYLRIDHGDDYTVPLPARLRPAVFYAIDTHLPHSWRKIRRSAEAYDLVACCHRDGAERLRDALWIPVACDWELHGVSRPSPVYDIGFVGTDGGVPRKFYLQALRERYPNSFIGAADYTQLASVYGCARIGFNYSIRNDVNMRMFEVMAGGALLVTNALADDDLSRLGLEDRRHLVLYRNPKQLFEVMEEFLLREEQRRMVAAAGTLLVKQRHTYVHRLRALLASMEERLHLTLFGGNQEENVPRPPSPVSERCMTVRSDG